jgi:hypothetical protein
MRVVLGEGPSANVLVTGRRISTRGEMAETEVTLLPNLELEYPKPLDEMMCQIALSLGP